MTRKSITFVGALALGLAAGAAQAVPVAGAPVLWGGGDLVLTNLASSSGYTNGIWFDRDGDAVAEGSDQFLLEDLMASKWRCCEPDFNDAAFRADSPVPLPGAVWLFGSALVGLVALNRRRRIG